MIIRIQMNYHWENLIVENIFISLTVSKVILYSKVIIYILINILLMWLVNCSFISLVKERVNKFSQTQTYI